MLTYVKKYTIILVVSLLLTPLFILPPTYAIEKIQPLYKPSPLTTGKQVPAPSSSSTSKDPKAKLIKSAPVSKTPTTTTPRITPTRSRFPTKSVPNQIRPTLINARKIKLADLFVERANLKTTNCSYIWTIRLKNRGKVPLSNLKIIAQQRTHPGSNWEQAALIPAGTIPDNQTKQRSIAWHRKPSAVQARFIVKQGNQELASIPPRDLPQVSIKILNLNFSRAQGNTYNWSASIKNNSLCPICSIKVTPFKKIPFTGWVPSNPITLSRINPNTSSTVNGTGMKSGVTDFRIVVSVKQGQQTSSPYATVTKTTVPFVLADQADIGNQISLTNVNISQGSNCVYFWNMTITNNSNQNLSDNLILSAQQHDPNDTFWKNAGSKMISSLTTGQSKSISMGSERDPGATQFKLLLEYQGNIIKEQPFSIQPFSASIVSFNKSYLGSDSYNWSVTVKNNSAHDICGVRIGIFKLGTEGWGTATAPRTNLKITAGNTISINDTISPQNNTQYKLMVQIVHQLGDQNQKTITMASKPITF